MLQTIQITIGLNVACLITRFVHVYMCIQGTLVCCKTLPSANKQDSEKAFVTE